MAGGLYDGSDETIVESWWVEEGGYNILWRNFKLRFFFLPRAERVLGTFFTELDEEAKTIESCAQNYVSENMKLIPVRYNQTENTGGKEGGVSSKNFRTTA